MKVRPAVIVIRDNQLLTMKYTFGGETVYGLPGGNPDPGESMPEALQREVMEELGVHLEVGDLRLVGEVVSWGDRKDTLHCLFQGTIAKEAYPVPNPEQTTCESVVWLDLSEMAGKTLYPQVAGWILHLDAHPLYIGRIEQPLH